MHTTLHGFLTRAGQQLHEHTDTPVLDAQVLAAHILKRTRTWVIAHPEYQPDTRQEDELEQALLRLIHGEPLPFLIGHWEFYGLDFHLTHDVLIPRPETELLVERGVGWLRQHPDARHAIDVGTGSGCIGIALAVNVPDLQVLLTDISSHALAVARENVQRHNLGDRLQLEQSDLLEGIDGTFKLVCTNLPYIASDELDGLAVIVTEPRLALDGGHDGTDLIYKLLDQVGSHLAPGGLLIMEIESMQGVEVLSYARARYPAYKCQLVKDLAGWNRCLEMEQVDLVLHLCSKRDWQEAQGREVYASSSLDQEGFIHCSTREQIMAVANRFYRGIRDLVVLYIKPEKITSEIRWEEADGGLFPHIYGTIDLPAVVGMAELKPDEDGTYVNLPELN
jgi:release factor glutamine methyltransferase